MHKRSREKMIENDLKYVTDTNEPFVIKGNTMYVDHNFNKSFEPYKKFMFNIKVLIFEDNVLKKERSCFDKPIILNPCLT